MRWRIGRRRQGRGPGAPAAHLFGHRSVTLPRRPAAGSDPGVSVLCCTLLWLHQTYQVLRRYIHPSAYPLFSSILHAQWAPMLTFAGRAFCLCALTQFSFRWLTSLRPPSAVWRPTSSSNQSFSASTQFLLFLLSFRTPGRKETAERGSRLGQQPDENCHRSTE